MPINCRFIEQLIIVYKVEMGCLLFYERRVIMNPIFIVTLQSMKKLYVSPEMISLGSISELTGSSINGDTQETVNYSPDSLYFPF